MSAWTSLSGAASAPRDAAAGGEIDEIGGCPLQRRAAGAADLGFVCNRDVPHTTSRAASVNPGTAPRERGEWGNEANQQVCVSSQNLAGAVKTAPALLRQDGATRTVWTPAMDAQLAAMRAEGHTLAAIGRVLGITASAVGGRVMRLGLPLPPSGQAPTPPIPARVWTRQDEARLLDLHIECDGDFRKIATKLARDMQDCRVRHRQLMMLKPRAIEVERKCLFCQRVVMIAKHNRVCGGCKTSETWHNASAWA